jgi:hypothetical protein
MQRPRAADDFAAIRARMEELRRERERAAQVAQGVDDERADERRWRLANGAWTKVLPRRSVMG